MNLNNPLGVCEVNMEDKLLGIQIKGILVKQIGNVYYIEAIKEITIDTRKSNRLLKEVDLIKIVNEL